MRWGILKMKGTAREHAAELPTIKVAVLFLVILTVAALLSLPATAHAANAYGQTFAGQNKCLENCHGAMTGGWQVGKYLNTAHAKFITPISSNPSALVPGASMWPSPAYAGGYMFGSSDIQWMLGAPGQWHQYVSKYKNTGSHTLGSGQTLLSIPGPADDYLMPNGVEWLTDHGVWENTAKVTARTYFQSCGGCHFLGVTRPTNASYTLGNGANVSQSTETSYSGIGIQCETCHGTGKTGDSHLTAGVNIVRTKQSLDSQVCGQCHVNGTAKEGSYVGGTFSGPNGYTPDRKLSDFFNIAGANYIWASPTATKPVIPTSDTKFYPNGSNKGMKHSYYNEWMVSAHARSLRWQNGSLWTPYANDSCLKCHSGEGFLKSIGYGSSRFPNDVSAGGSSLSTDKLDIECGVCHTVHAQSGETLGLRLGAEELCAKCHNSEIKEGQSAVAGVEVHHPQREMIQGYGLIGVSRPTKRFMGDTECPACHMPQTKYTLKSHSFKPMLPGNATTWGVQDKGDSCTPCHTSSSREELQRDIDEWAGSLKHAEEVALADVAAAKARAGATTDAGKLLIASAETNIHFVEADESKGAHNYPYAKAGLQKASFFAEAVGTSFTRFGATPYYPAMKLAMLYGTLNYGNGSPAAGQRVTILARANGSNTWTTVGKATVGDDGDFGFAVGPTGTTTYMVAWSPRTGVEFYSATSKVTMYSSARVSVSKARFRRGSATTISGSVSPNHSGSVITIQYKKGSRSYRTLARRTLGSTSKYSYRWKPTSRGTYYVRTVFSGDASHNGSRSSARKVVVR